MGDGFLCRVECLNVVTFKQRTMPKAWFQLTKLSKFLLNAQTNTLVCSVNDQTMIIQNSIYQPAML